MTEGCVKHKLAHINSALNGGISAFSHKALDQQNKLNLLSTFLMATCMVFLELLQD